MITIGIECESAEGDSWGIGRTVKELISEIERRPELKKEFRFIYYHKKNIPSFSLYYYIILPIKIFLTKPDIVFFPNYMLPFGVFCKTIVTLTEDGYEAMHSKWLPFRYRLAYRIFMNHAARKATKINVYSKTSGIEVARLFGIDQKRIFVNYLGVRAVKPLISDLAVSPLSYILYVGQMFPRRHARETILACKKLGIKLIMVGIDKYNPKLDINVEHYDRVSEEKLEELYKNARLFVYVSDTEAFGLPPLEALARGVRPIVADTDVAHELLGDDAVYCEPSVDGITDGIKRGLALPKPQSTNNFSWKDHTDRFIELCRTL